MNRGVFLCFLSLAISIVSWSNNQIHGTAIGHEGSSVTLCTYNDYYNQDRKVVSNTEVADDGSFTLDFEFENIKLVALQIGVFSANMFLHPQQNYSITIEPRDSCVIRSLQLNQIAIYFNGLEESDMNMLSTKYNNMFDSFFAENFPALAIQHGKGSALYVNSRSNRLSKMNLISDKRDTTYQGKSAEFYNAVKLFESNCHAYFSNDSLHHPFFDDYLQYSIAELKFNSGWNRNEIYKEYLNDAELIDNPAFASFFTAFYSGEVLNMLPDHRFTNFSKAYRKGFSLDSIRIEAASFEYLSNQNIIDLALLIGSRQVYFKNREYKNAASICIELFSEDKQSPSVHVAIAMHESLYKWGVGSTFESSRLVSQTGVLTETKFNEGRYTFVCFYASWNSESLNEVKNLDRMIYSFQKEVDFVAISLDEDYEVFQRSIDTYNLPQMSYLFGSGDPLILDKWGVRALPDFYFIDGEGKNVFEYTKRPSEGVALEIEKEINSHRKKPIKLKVWDD